MSHYELRRARAPKGYVDRGAYALIGHTPGALVPDGKNLRFTWGCIRPETFTSVSTFRRWFERQGHTLDIIA